MRKKKGLLWGRMSVILMIFFVLLSIFSAGEMNVLAAGGEPAHTSQSFVDFLFVSTGLATSIGIRYREKKQKHK